MARSYVYTAFGGPEVQSFADLPVPDVAPGEILVRVHTAGVNPADWKRRANFRHSPDPVGGPTPMGLEVAGTVEAVGPGDSPFAVGDTVFGAAFRNGGFSEYSVLSVDQAAVVPEGVSLEDAATLPIAAATAYDAVVQLAVVEGDTVLITGAGGGVGIAAVQIARDRGALVIGTASPAKAPLLQSVGAIHVPYGPGEDRRVRAAAPDGVGALFDNVGGDSLRALAPLVATPARIVSAGDGATATELGGAPVARVRNSEVLRILGRLVAEGRLRPFVTEVFPFDGVADAIALVENGHATGKVVVRVS